MRARTCTIFAWVYGEDVDAVCSTLIVPTKNFRQKQEGKHNNEGFGWLSHCLHGGESWIFYQTVPRPPWFSKSKLYGHTWNIYNFASYLWFKKSQYNREAVLNRSTSYPPCITAIETSHKQKEDVYNGTTNDFPSIHLPSAVGSLKVDNLHTTVFDISPRKYISQVFFSSVWQKQHQATKDFLLMDLMSRGSTVYRTDPPPLCSKSLLLRICKWI